MARFAPSFLAFFIILLLFSYSGAEKTWCIASPFASKELLQSNIDFACSHADCGPIQVDGSCFLPNTLTGHASFAMNSYYQNSGRTPQSCYFDHSGLITPQDPSYGTCHYN